jgi:nucleoside 2-deoxyribosyltransferase
MARPFVFVLMPFKPEFNDIYRLGIKAACEEAGATCERVDEQIYLENMLQRIYGQIDRADFIVADMSVENPNVYYEAGYAHGHGKPVVLLTREASKIPFDLKQYSHVTYEAGKISELKEDLKRVISHLMKNPADAVVSRAPNKEDHQAKFDRMTKHIENYFIAKGFRFVGFEAIQKYVNETYSDDLLKQLIDERPDRFRRVMMKEGKPGIGPSPTGVQIGS